MTLSGGLRGVAVRGAFLRGTGNPTVALPRGGTESCAISDTSTRKTARPRISAEATANVDTNVAVGPGGGSIMLVQEGNSGQITGPASVSYTFPSPTTIGNCLILEVTTGGSSPASCSGGGVGTWQHVVAANNGNGTSDIYYGFVTSSGQTVVTISGGASYAGGIGGEFSGVDPGTPVSSSGSLAPTSAGTTFNMPSLTSTKAGQLYVGGGYPQNGIPTPYTQTSGFTNFVNLGLIGTDAYNCGGWQVVSGAGAYQLEYSAWSASYYNATSAFFNPAASGPAHRTATGSETTAVGDVSSQVGLVKRSGTEATALADTVVRVIGNLRVGVEATANVDTSIRSQIIHRQATGSETTSAQDTTTRQAVDSRTGAEAVANADSSVRNNLTARSGAESTANVDSPHDQAVLIRSGSENAANVDASTRKNIVSRLGAEAATNVDTNVASTSGTSHRTATGTEATASIDTSGRFITNTRLGAETASNVDTNVAFSSGSTRRVASGAETTAAQDSSSRASINFRLGNELTAVGDTNVASASGAGRRTATGSESTANADSEAQRNVLFRAGTEASVNVDTNTASGSGAAHRTATGAETTANSDTVLRLVINSRRGAETTADIDTSTKGSGRLRSGSETTANQDSISWTVFDLYRRGIESTVLMDVGVPTVTTLKGFTVGHQSAQMVVQPALTGNQQSMNMTVQPALY
jgi:hypothetical protein